MVFSSAIFIFCFLPILFLIYFISPKRYRNYILLLFSLIFYGFGGIKYLIIILSVVLIDYFCALLIDKYNSKKIFLVLSVMLNVGVLFFYKYTGFFVSNINGLFDSSFIVPKVIMPIGISFYIFQSLSYVIDVYKKKVSVQKNYFLLLLYVSLFPQLVAGPIVRYSTIEKEINDRKVSIDDFCYGIERFILGLSKKLIIANQMGKLADIVFSGGDLSCPVAWLGAISYMFQIYFDFSAYSDMAIGLGRIFGFHFLENFNFPYISKSITEFWRRWHISLSTWFRDYVYIPLGGNKKGVLRQILNMSIVWLLTGFWHGAAWNFVLWGVYYFIFLVIEKYVLKKVLNKLPSFFLHIYALLIILIGWVLFRSDNISMFFNIVGSMFNFSIDSIGIAEARIYIETYYVYFILGIIFSTPIYYVICDKFKNNNLFMIIKYIGLLILFVIAILFLAQSSYNPFIYFRF